ncbi:hypothetical protein GIB67_022923 [Kingdonia uniflora]|uniref:Uncharacterized protein n=1 Tax=Kingdonia uniflora TaxID=39325 RepID=A0A7J7P320_9MAGN|nr:hypothetical protein GIB67_022923 [Kingdonia uniflora]
MMPRFWNRGQFTRGAINVSRMRKRINSSSTSPSNRFITKNLKSTQRKRQKIRGINQELSEGDKRLKRAKGLGSRRWEYNSVVRGKLDFSADLSKYPVESNFKMGRLSVNEVSTSGKMNEFDSGGEGGLQQFLGFPGQTWNDNIICVMGNCLQRDDKALLDLRFRSVKQSVKSTVERKESLFDEAAKEETELELVLGELSLSRKKKEFKRQINKALPASGTTVTGEIAQGKRMRVEPLGNSGEKFVEGRSASMDDLKEVEERARLAILQGKEDTSQMVVHLIKEIWLGIEEQESELKKAKSELEKNLASAKTDALKEVKQQKAAHAVVIVQLQVEAKANLDETAEEHDRLGRHLMLKGYSQEEVDTIKADTYAEEEDEEAGVLGVVDGLDGVSPQTVISDLTRQVEEKDFRIKKGLEDLSEATERVENLQRHVDALAVKGKHANMAQYRIQALERIEELCRSDLNKCRIDLERIRQKFIRKDDELRVARENLSASEAAAEHLQTALPTKDMEF